MKSRRRAKRLRGRILFFLIAVLLLSFLICGLAAGYIFLSAKLPSVSLPQKYTIYYGSDSETTSKMKNTTYKLGQFRDDRTVYVDFSALADYCGFYVSGDSERLRFILPAEDGLDLSEFTVWTGSNRIDLNGMTVHMSAPAVMQGETLYLPIEFIDCYVQGISVTAHETKENAYVIRCSEEAVFYLTSSPQLPSPPIDRSALDQ